jgi:hypothetical protein
VVPLLLGVGLEVVEDGRSDEQVREGAHHQGQGADVLLLHFAAAAVIWRTAASLFFHQPDRPTFYDATCQSSCRALDKYLSRMSAACK